MLDQVQNFVTSLSGQVSIIAIVLEFTFRLMKTEKPLSIAHAVAAAGHKISDIFGGIANLLDKVLPQNLK